MPTVSSTSRNKVRSFWDRYIQKLHESGIKPPFDRWFVLRAEQYIEAHPNSKLAEQRPSDVDDYLADLGRRGGLKDWQFRQTVDAIQNLFEFLGVAWFSQVDWEHWRASARLSFSQDECKKCQETIARPTRPWGPGSNGTANRLKRFDQTLVLPNSGSAHETENGKPERLIYRSFLVCHSRST